MYAQNLRAFSL